MEKARQEIVGKVVSAANNKTITIATESYRKHPLYHKRVKSTKKLLKILKKSVSI